MNINDGNKISAAVNPDDDDDDDDDDSDDIDDRDDNDDRDNNDNSDDDDDDDEMITIPSCVLPEPITSSPRVDIYHES